MALQRGSVARATRAIVSSDVALLDAIRRRYGNYSAIARMIRPKVEEDLQRGVRLESIITTLKRIKVPDTKFFDSIRKVMANSVINVRTDVAKLSIEKTRGALLTVRKVLADYQEEFLQVSESISAITLVFDKRLLEEVRSIFRVGQILEEKDNLAAIIMHSPREIIDTPGCVAAFYDRISRRGINIDDTISCYTDTIIVVRMEDVGAVFSSLTDLIAEARRPP